jgi:hypothetical protein
MPSSSVPRLAALLLAAALAASGAQAGEPPARGDAFDPDGHAQTCKHFANRARFRARGATSVFVVRAANACAEALALPVTDRDAERVLERLTLLRLTLRAINVARIYGDDPAPDALPAGDVHGMRRRGGASSRPVSETGEYLIARELGVQATLDAWRAAPAAAGPVASR